MYCCFCFSFFSSLYNLTPINAEPFSLIKPNMEFKKKSELSVEKINSIQKPESGTNVKKSQKKINELFCFFFPSLFSSLW